MAAIAIAAMSLGIAPAHAASDENANAKAWLGVYSQEFTDALRDGLDYKGEGVLVNRVVPQSPADRAGLRKGDVIVRLNSRMVRTPEDLSNLVQAENPGRSIALEIVRNGEKRTLNATLAARPSEEDRTWARSRSDEDGEGFETPEAPEVPETPDMSDLPDSPAVPEFKGRLPRTFHFENLPRDFQGMFTGRGRLGVRLEDLNPDLAGALGSPGGKGALVLEVIKDTPAERAGLKAGDIITSIGSKKVYDSGDVIEALRGADQKVALSVVRRGSSRTLEAQLDPETRTMFRSQDGPLGDRIRIQNRLDDGDLREQMRQLREEMKQLRDQMRELHRN
jgi:serine protease Do